VNRRKPSIVARVRRAAAVIALLGLIAASSSFLLYRHVETKTAAAWERTTRVSAATLETMRAVRSWEADAVLLFDRQRTAEVGAGLTGSPVVVDELAQGAAGVDTAFRRLRAAVAPEFVPGVDAAEEKWDEAVLLAATPGTDLGVFRQVLKDLDDVGMLLERVVDDVTASNQSQLAQVGALQRNTGLVMIALLLSVVAGMFASAVRLSRHLARGFTSIRLATQRFADNDLDHRVPSFGEADIDALGLSFNGMAERLGAGQRQLEHLATTDPLTGLPNRRALLQLMRSALEAPIPNPSSGTFVLLDLDGFKEINDAFGHSAGDQVLVEMARRIQRILGEGDVVARLGGDEFALLLGGPRDVPAAESLVRVVLDQVRQPLELPGLTVSLAASAGLAHGRDVATADELLRNADLAMYDAKKHGRGRTAWFHPQMQSEVAERVALQAALKVALEQDQFVVHYQPILDAGTGRVAAVEALVRWQHPELGLLGPDRFIPLAESTGEILRLGAVVLGKALEVLSELDLPPLDGILRMNVNLSPRQLQSHDLVDVVRTALASSGVSPDRLVLEITESALIEDLDLAISQLEELKRLGVQLALDDFGAGYCSLSYLGRLPVDSVKIDRSLTAPVLASRHAASIIEAVVHIGAVSGFRVVAEGVETSEQAHALNGIGCDQLQGYLYSRPVPTADLAPVLARLAAAAPQMRPVAAVAGVDVR
jgi:diguanylate cyclase (GGDEF)-like protein